MKKRLIALMIAGTISTSTLAGCSEYKLNNTEENKNTSTASSLHDDGYIGVTDKYIVIDQNDTDILHKGAMGIMYKEGGYDGGPTTDYKYHFDCGEKTISNSEHQIFDTEPKEERYDKKCEECFGIEQ